MVTETVLEDFLTAVLSNATVTSSGSWTGPTDFGNKEISLFINITAAPTGTAPSIAFVIQELDPGDQVTPSGTSVGGATLTTSGTQILTLPVSYGGTVQVSWTVEGTSPSFTGVYATLINKGTSPAIYDQDGNGPVAVKPANISAQASDPALTVALSPNSPLPAGTNEIGSVTVQGVSGGQPVAENLSQVGGSAIATSATGVQKVGIVGNAGGTLDASLFSSTAPTNGVGVLAQYNVNQPTPSAAHTMSLQADQSGNLLSFPGVQAKSGSAWGQSTPVNTVQYPTGNNVQGAPLGGMAVVVQLDQIDTFTAGAVTFQGTYDNGNNWVTIPQWQILNPQNLEQVSNPYTFQSNVNQPFMILLNGFQQIRMNLTTAIVTNGAVAPYWTILSEVSLQNVLSGNLSVGQYGPWNVGAYQSGTWTVESVQSGPWAVGATQSGTWTVEAEQEGTWTVEAAQSGPWSVAATQSGSWTVQQGNAPWAVVGEGAAGSPAGGVVSVQGVSGGTNVPVCGTVAVSEVGGSVAVTGTVAVSGVSGTTEVAGTVTSSQGASAPLSGAWPMELTDGTNGPVAVKPASTPAAASDASFVVALSPNSPLPAGANALGTVAVTGTVSMQGVSGGEPVAVTSVPLTASVYSVAIRALAPTSSDPTDLITISGSATKTVRVQKIRWSATQSTAGTEEIDLVRRSSANTGGTSTTQTPVYYDSDDPTATATVLAYTVNPSSLGTSVGNMEAVKLLIPTTTSGSASEPYEFDFTSFGGVVLRGTSQLLAVNWGNGAALPSGLSIDCTIWWTEQ